MKIPTVLAAGITLFWAVSAPAGDLSFPANEQEITDALSFKEQKVVHKGQEYESTSDGQLFMIVEGKRYRMKGIGGITETSLVPKAGALLTFDINSARIKNESFSLLHQYGNVLTKKLTDAKLIIEGHTDAQGAEGYNSQLSEERALAVKKYLVTNYDISPDRLLIRGVGENRPIADNETEDGRALNRRVEFIRALE